MKLGTGTIPISWARMSNFQKVHLRDQSSVSCLQCYEKGADIVKALFGLCTMKNANMRRWQDFMENKYRIRPVELHEIKKTLTLFTAAVRDLYQCSDFCPLDFLDFLYGTKKVTYDEGETKRSSR